MNFLLVFLFAALACCLLFGPSRGWPAQNGAARVAGTGRGMGRSRVRVDADLAMIRIVRQMAALLTAGRSGPMLWAELAATVAAEAGVGDQDLPTAILLPGTSSPSRAGPLQGARKPDRADPGRPPGQTAHLSVLLAAQQASIMGFPASAALRAACQKKASGTARAPDSGPWPGGEPGPRSGPTAGPGTGVRNRLSTGQAASWREVAACFEVCEASGAPLAAVLQRLAARLESEQDAAALRATALAGPRATVRLLSWLPFIGFLLGIAMGVDPVGVLLGGPVGWATLAAGLSLTGIGRWWSNHLIRVAAGPGRAPMGAQIGTGARRRSRRRTEPP